MATPFECLGMPIQSTDELSSLLRRIEPEAHRIGQVGDQTTYQWRDPSGLTLCVTLCGNEVLGFLARFSGEPGVMFAGVEVLAGHTVRARVVDTLDDGAEPLAGVIFDCEQALWLAACSAPWAGLASITALCIDVTIRPDSGSPLTPGESPHPRRRPPLGRATKR